MRAVILAGALWLFFLAAGAFPAKASVTLEPLLAAKDWLNGAPSAGSTRGKVVLVDFYTFSCINCKHVQPNLRTLYRTIPRSDLAIIAVHSPESPFEHVRALLLASMRTQGVAWPVAVDNDFSIWNDYGIRAWPTQLIFDRHGVLRESVIGDSQDALVDGWVKRLLAERRVIPVRAARPRPEATPLP